MRSLQLLLITVFLNLFSKNIDAQDFYRIDTIQKIEITFSQPNWDYILDTAKQGSDSYTMAQSVSINGILYDSVGVKYKGNSSYNPNYAKNPIHIELDHFKDQDYRGFKDIKLSNGFHEPSFIRETLLYSIIGNYMPAPRANFAQVYINGQLHGLYTNVEAVTKTFLEDRFYSNNHTFVFADYGGCNLVYKGADSSLYFNNYTLKSDYGWNDLVSLCSTLKNNINSIETVLDVDRTLWMLAVTNSMVILDSYIGQPSHNYYLYQDHNGRFNPIVWDLNGGLGVFNRPGNGPDLTVSQMQTMPIFLHQTDTLWPLVNKLLNIPKYRRMYVAHMRTIVDEFFTNNLYLTEGLYMQGIADTAVQSDPNKFYTYQQFINNMYSNVVDGPKTMPGITLLMNARNTHLLSTPDFQYAQPVIANIQPSDTTPALNSVFYITAQITNLNGVVLGHRGSVMDPFTKVQMLDDGLHGDGTAGDGIYGATLTMTTYDMQYYLYAENTNAGIFSPARAEYEFYTLHAGYPMIASGEIVINELMALNSTTVQTGNGSYSDWIELFNNTTNTVSLDNLYLSDDATSPYKWRFPDGTLMTPGSFLMVWADEDSVPGELHCNFKLSGNGEQVVMSYPGGSVVDVVSFGTQTSDITYGRYPNGTGPFVIMPPTFNTYNTLTGIDSPENSSNALLLYPNPASGSFVIELQGIAEGDYRFDIFDAKGAVADQIHLRKGKNEVITTLPAGIYFCKVNDDAVVFPTIKLVMQ